MIVSAVAEGGTKLLTLAMSEVIVEHGVQPTDFTIVSDAELTVTAVAVLDNKINLTLSDFVQNNQNLSLEYTNNNGLTDNAGNPIASIPTNKAIEVTVNNDNNAATVASVSLYTPEGEVAQTNYKSGEEILIKVEFNEAVNVTGTPSLDLALEGRSVQATYQTGGGTESLIFTYTVTAGNAANDLDYGSITALSGTIQDNAGNNANLNLPVVGSAESLSGSNINIDTTPPSILGGAITGGTNSLVLNISEALSGTVDNNNFQVEVNGQGNTITDVVLSSSGGTNGQPAIILTLSTAIPNNANISVSYTGEVLQDAAGNLLPNNSQLDATGVTVTNDNNVPVIESVSVDGSTPDGEYKLGETILIAVNFDKPVKVSDAGTPPSLELQLSGGAKVNAIYDSGSTSDTLIFNYTVQNNNTAPDLAYSNINALKLNGSTISDNTSNLQANTALPSPGTAGSLSDNANIVIDGVLPTIVSTVAEGGTKLLTPTMSEFIVEHGVQPTDFTIVSDAELTVTAVAVLDNKINLTLSDFVQNNQNLSLEYTNNNGLTDNAGNPIASIPTNKAIEVTVNNDNNAATVASVSLYTPEGEVAQTNYKSGEEILIKVEFNEAVNVTGTPNLDLALDGKSVQATYHSGNGTSNLVFTYTVQNSDKSSDLDYSSTNAINLNNGSIHDHAGNIANLELPAVGTVKSLSQSNIVIDTVPPAIASANITGGTKELTLNLTETVSGTLDKSDFTVTANSVSNVVSDVNLSDNCQSLIIVLTDFVANNAALDISYSGSSLQDAAGNQMGAITITGSDITVTNDNNVPTVIAVNGDNNGPFKQDDSFNITVQFTEAVNVSGTPEIALDNGGAPVTAKYVSGTGTDTLTFTYTVQPNDNATDLAYSSVNALQLSAGDSIIDNANNSANTILPAPGSSGSLSANADIVIDTDAPSIISGEITAGTNSLLVQVSEAVQGTPNKDDFTVTNNKSNATISVSDATLSSDGLSITLTLSEYLPNFASVSLDYANNTASLKDTADNPMASATLQSADIIVTNDYSSPVVTEITVSTGTYDVDDVIDITVTLDKPVNIIGTPALSLETGSTDQSANYSSGSGTATLVFQYTVQAGDSATNLDLASTTPDYTNGQIQSHAGNLLKTLPAGSLSSSAVTVDTSANLTATMAIDSTDTVDNLTQSQLDVAAEVALQDWSSLLNEVEIREVTFEVVDLGGRILGKMQTTSTDGEVSSATSPYLVSIDQGGAGYGWHIDPYTPIEQATTYDLYTVLLHEIGHVYGLDHDVGGLMNATLAPGQRITLDQSGITTEMMNEYADVTLDGVHYASGSTEVQDSVDSEQLKSDIEDQLQMSYGESNKKYFSEPVYHSILKEGKTADDVSNFNTNLVNSINTVFTSHGSIQSEISTDLKNDLLSKILSYDSTYTMGKLETLLSSVESKTNSHITKTEETDDYFQYFFINKLRSDLLVDSVAIFSDLEGEPIINFAEILPFVSNSEVAINFMTTTAQAHSMNLQQSSDGLTWIVTTSPQLPMENINSVSFQLEFDVVDEASVKNFSSMVTNDNAKTFSSEVQVLRNGEGIEDVLTGIIQDYDASITRDKVATMISDIASEISADVDVTSWNASVLDNIDNALQGFIAESEQTAEASNSFQTLTNAQGETIGFEVTTTKDSQTTTITYDANFEKIGESV